MPIGIWNKEWLNANSQRSYPFTEDATKQDQTGALSLPDDLILGIRFPIHAGLSVVPTGFYLSQLSVYGSGVSLTISYWDGSSSQEVATTAVATATHNEYDQYSLIGKNNFDDSVGQIVFGRKETLEGLPPGNFQFAYQDGKLEVDAIVPMIADVRSLVIVNGPERSQRYTGDIELVAGSNIRLTPIVTIGQPTKIRIDAIDGEGLNEDCVCDESEAPPIRTINGIPPDNSGNYKLLGGTCIDITGVTGGLRVDNVCAEPCCGCDELEALTQELEIFGDTYTTLRGFVNRLQSEVTNMSQVVLGSRLNDDGCFTCDLEP